MLSGMSHSPIITHDNSQLSDDVWRSIYGHLDVEARQNVTLLSHRLANLFSHWADITMISVKDDSVSLAGKHFKCRLKSDLASILSHCPNLNCVIIQTHLTKSKLQSLATIKNTIELSMPSSLLRIKDSILGDLLRKDRIKVLRILHRYDELKSIRNLLRLPQALMVAALPLSVLQLQGVSLLPKAFEVLCIGLSSSLIELKISGSLCNSPDFDNYMNSMGLLRNLQVLELPPSLFSLCHRSLPPKLAIVGSLPLLSLAVYVHYYIPTNIAEFFNYLPRTLTELILFRTTELDEILWKADFPNLKFTVRLFFSIQNCEELP
ncbi:hypothetical protein AB6A40_008830 [Gnathostoma spinigerum]|uniref:F-box domain-containing protein n=1 Tax=Gnathostoma spinigerum TaxID=75299 RepID=A0ABD6EXB3_9BILA